MTSFQGFPSIFYGEPGVLGMLSNGISAFLVMLLNFHAARTGQPPEGLENTLAGVHLILIGGVCQLVAGLLSFRKYDHLSGTAFVGYSALWASYGATQIFLGKQTDPSLICVNNSFGLSNQTSEVTDCRLHLSLQKSAIAGLTPYILLSVLLAFCSATVNYIMPLVFGAITAALAFEAAALVAGPWALVVSGVLELFILIFAIYGSSALLLKGLTQRLALGGFGTPLFNVLLLGTGSTQTSGEEKKKVTKYAEPMALGFFCDTVSAFIFIFYGFGYIETFGLGAVWVSIVSVAQVLSSYYSHLHLDCYHTTKFGVHAMFWLIKAWEEFTASVLIKNETALSAGREAMLGNWIFVVASLVISVVSLNMDILELVHNLLFFMLTVSSTPQMPLRHYHAFFGVTSSLFSAASLYGTFSRLINTIAEKSLIPVGPPPVSTTRLLKAFGRRSEKAKGPTEISDALFYLSNGVAALSALHTGGSSESSSLVPLTLPWVFISGATIQAYVSRLQASGGGRFASVISAFYVAVWATWTWFRIAGDLLQLTSGYEFTAGAAAFLVINGFLVVIAAYRNLVLVFLTAMMELLLVCFLLSTLQRLPPQLEVASLSLFTSACVFGTLASTVNHVFSQRLIPVGSPLLKTARKESSAETPCTIMSSKLTSGLLRVAKILEEGGVCGVPTDTVYALAASCKNPAAIEHIYNIKERPAEKPICICISSVEQLETAKPPFSPLLWEFMRNVNPGGVSCIVRKGDWLLKLGVGAAYDRVGTADSIMIRIPDHTVTAHLCEITGPLAITSANPSGEADSTHHDMVINRLGQRIQGVLCDGETSEVVGSTVVNCLKIDEGIISILREGCVPALTVKQIFERVRSTMV